MIEVLLEKNSDGDYEAVANLGGIEVEGVPPFEVVTYSETGFSVARIRMLKVLRHLGFIDRDAHEKVRWEYAAGDAGETPDIVA